MGKKPFVFHDASMRPRLRTAPNPLALGVSEWQIFYDARLADQTISARFGTSTLGALVSNGSFRGMTVGPFMGVETMFVATYVTGAVDPADNRVRVYMSTDGATWSEITKQFSSVGAGGVATSIGPYGDTRLVDDGLVWFAFCRDRDVKVYNFPSASPRADCMLFGNQSSFPRVYSPFYGGGSAISGNYAAIIEAISAPVGVRNTAVQARLFEAGSAFNLRDVANTTYINSGANYVLADSGASGTNNTLLLTIGTSSAAGDTAIIDMGNACALLNGKQIHIGVTTATILEFLAKNKIEVGNYSGSFTSAGTLMDPTGQLREVIVSTLEGTNNYMLSIDVEDLNTAATYDALRFTFKGSAPAAGQTANIFMVAPGPYLESANPGQTLAAFSHFNVGTHTESPGVVFANYSYPDRFILGGGVELPDDYTKLAPPASADIYFSFYMPIPNPTQAQLEKGVEAARIYRRRPGELDFSLVENYELGTYSEPGAPPAPTWAFTGSTAALEVRRISLLSRASLSPTSYPDSESGLGENHIPIPKCRAGIGTPDRFFAGSKVSGTPAFLFSAFAQPFRMRGSLSINATDGSIFPFSAGAVNLNDQINGFAQVSAAAVGLAPVTSLVMAVYAFGETYPHVAVGKTSGELSQLATIGTPGCISPGTIAVNNDEVTYLNREMNVMRLRGMTPTDISKQRVDDITTRIPSAYRRLLWGTYHGDKYYLHYVPFGATTMTRILVWDDAIIDRQSGQVGDWCSIDRPPKVCEGSLSWFDSATDTQKLVAFMQNVGEASTLTAYLYDGSTTTDLGANISLEGTSFEMHDPAWTMINVDRIGIVAQQVTGGTITWTITYKPSGGTKVVTMSLAESGLSYIRRFTNKVTAVRTGQQEGGSMTLNFAASVPGGTKILEIQAEIEASGDEFQVP